MPKKDRKKQRLDARTKRLVRMSGALAKIVDDTAERLGTTTNSVLNMAAAQFCINLLPVIGSYEHVREVATEAFDAARDGAEERR